MPDIKSKYDAVIIGAGHNGLVAACYLARAGLSVLVLERNAHLGGATRSARVFDGYDANLSVYSYLVSLFPQKIVDDLGLNLELRPRTVSSCTPYTVDGDARALVLRNGSPDANRAALRDLTGSDDDYRGLNELADMQRRIADVVWPSLTRPFVTRSQMRDTLDAAGRRAWDALIEQPLGQTIERHLRNDLLRGVVFTDAKIGVSTHPHDPTLLQNCVFLYHVVGRGDGLWRVPVGGMGRLVEELTRVAESTAKVTFALSADVQAIDADGARPTVSFRHLGHEHQVDARFVLCNASRDVLDRLMHAPTRADAPTADGSVFKINMLLERLPHLRDPRTSAADAFAGTFHIDEGYDHLTATYKQSMSGIVPDRPPGEMYCHTLTDNSILADDLAQRGYHTLTLFGLDTPYTLFEQNNEAMRDRVAASFLAGLNRCLAEPIEDCIAKSPSGQPCIEAKSPVDLECDVHLPRGHIFHGDLTWPFVEDDEEAGRWGVETEHENVYLCGSAALRGGAVSGIPGHNAAMKVFDVLSM